MHDDLKALSLEQSVLLKASPFLRWAGSKKQLVYKLKSFWDEGYYTNYIEPFAGAAHLYFSIQSEKSILSDVNPELINTYTIVKNSPERVYYTLKLMPVEKEYYYNIRAKDVTSLTHFERAVRFIYLNRYCFNGLYRTDLKGRFNVPFSPSRSGEIPPLQNWLAASAKLANTELLCNDFQSVIKAHASKGSFIYLDPPYLSEKRAFTEYHPANFSQSDLNRLVDILEYIDSIGAYFVLSYGDYAPIKKVLSHWNMETVSLKRKISCITENRNLVNEIIATNIG